MKRIICIIMASLCIGYATAATAMDYYNNSIGYWIGEQTRLEGGSRSDVYDRVFEVACFGGLHYLIE